MKASVGYFRPRYMRIGNGSMAIRNYLFRNLSIEDAKDIKTVLEKQRQIKANGGYPWDAGEAVKGYNPNIYDEYFIEVADD